MSFPHHLIMSTPKRTLFSRWGGSSDAAAGSQLAVPARLRGPPGHRAVAPCRLRSRLQRHRCRDCRDRGTRNIPGTPQFAWHRDGGGPGVVARVGGSLPGQVGGTRGARATPPNTTIASKSHCQGRPPVQLAMQRLPPPPARLLQPRCRVQGAVLVSTPP